MDGTRYLLTGAAGNLGSSIARQLVSAGKAVRALVLEGDRAAERLPKEVELVGGDLSDEASLRRFFDGAEPGEAICIHCASIVTVSPAYSRKVYEVNVEGTRRIVDLCVERGLRKLVYVSSTSAIPEAPGNRLIEEVSDFDPEAVRGFYGQTKAEASRIVMEAVRERGLDASIVFPSGICGPGDYAYGPFSSFIVDYAAGAMKGGVAGSFNAVDVRDLAAGVIACCERGRRGEGYIMANELVTMAAMFRLLSSLTGVPQAKIILPIPAAYALAALASLAGKLTGAKPRLTSFAVYNLARNNNFTSAKAEKELGYSVRPFAETVADTVAWLRAEGKIA